MATLPDDVILEILLRVPGVHALFRCATTCKAWRRQIADLSFLRRRWPENKKRDSSSLLGFFLRGYDYIEEWKRDTRDIPNPLRTPAFVPTPRSALGPARRFLGSLIPDAARLLSDATPLTSRRGLLLVRLEPRASLAVCNLLTGTCDVLPPLECKSSFTTCRCAILTDDDHSSSTQDRSPLPEYSTSFKVLIISDPCWDSPGYNLHMFSSAETDWTALGRCSSHEEQHNKLEPLDCGAIVCRGTTHWLFRGSRSNYYTLDVSNESGVMSLTKVHDNDLPAARYPIPWLSTATDEELSLLFLCEGLFLEDLRVEILTRQSDEGSTADWIRTRTVELKQPARWCTSIIGHCKYMGEKSGTLLFMNSDQAMYVVDLETRQFEEVNYQFRGLNCNTTVVPVEIEWPAFFMSRLGERSC